MISTDEFLKLLAGSNVVGPEVVEKLRRRVAESRSPVDATRIAQKLVDRGDLTAWQARQLLAGRNAFFLGKYQLLERIGAGGMGVVFKSRHALMNRTVAIKVMAKELLNRPTALARFNREVKAAAALNHPNIIAAYDADSVGNTHFLVMEYVDGRDLNHWLRATGQFPVAAACECAMQVAEGLQHAYRQGMVHRDIKPVNLLVQWSKEQNRPIVKILDMGLARFASESTEEAELTRAGQTIGTPDYIAPEAADNFRQADIRADIFSLGCTLFRLLTGKLPFAGANTVQKLLARSKDDAPLVSSLRPDVPAGLDQVLAKMMAREVGDRYQTPAEVAAALAPFAASRTGEAAALEFLRHAPADALTQADNVVEGDADTSLEEFFRDFSLVPLRDEGAAHEHALRPPQEAMPAKKDAGRPKPAPPAQEEIGLADELTPLPQERAAAQPKAAAAAKPAGVKTAAAARPPAGANKPAQAPPPPPPRDFGRLDDLLADDGLLGSGGIDLNEPPADEPEAPKEKRKFNLLPFGGKNKKGLDSNFLLYGGGALLLLVIMFVALYVSLSGETADQQLAAADGLYAAGSDFDAIERYDAFLEAYPDSPKASLARVRRGIAKMRLAITTNRDWAANVKQCEEVLKEISKEHDYPPAAGDVVNVLTKLGESLARVAEVDKKPEMVGLGRQALALTANENFVPKDSLPADRIAKIEGELSRIEEDLGRDAALTATLAGIAENVAARKTAEAFALRQDLLKRYPTLETDTKLQEAVLSISTGQQQEVVISTEAQAAAPDEASDATTLALADTSGNPVSELQGQVYTTLADGAAWGIDAATGAPLWRRWVGALATSPPIPVGKQPGDDVLVVSSERGEIARVAARDGAIKWRHACGEPLVGAPLVVGQQALVAARSGVVRWISLADGASKLQARIPQELSSGPVADTRGKKLYQLAANSSLYILDAADGRCLEVLYLGHEPGSIAIAPVAVSRYLIVAENHKASDARLRVVILDDEGIHAQQVQQIDLAGRLFTPPVVAGRNLHAVTDTGAWYSFEIAQPGEGEALKKVIDRAAAEGEPVVRFPIIRGSDAWVAEGQLARYEVQTARARLVPQGVSYQNDLFLQAPLLAGDYLLSVRRTHAPAGVAIAATRTTDGQTAWETRIAARPVAAPWTTPAGSVELLRGDGRLFVVAPANLAQSGVQPKAAATIELTHPPAAPVEAVATGGFRAMAADTEGGQLLLRRATGEPPLAWLKIADVLSGPLMPAGAGLVVPGQSGQVHVINPADGSAVVQPFQPPLEPGVKYRWQGVAAAEEQLLVSDLQTKLYLLKSQGTPAQLTAVASIDLAEPLTSPLAVTANTAYGVLARGRLQAWSLPDLQLGELTPLGADAVWGPVSAGPLTLVAAADDQILAMDDGGAQKWKVPLVHGRPTGTVTADGDQLTFVTASGVVQSVNASDGQTAGEIDLGQPVAAGPVIVGDRLVVVAVDGTLIAVRRP